VTQIPDGPYESEIELDDSEDPDVPELNTDSDNQPDAKAAYEEVDTQDPEGTEVPKVNKHTDGEA
jgi:hypothetical protein